MSMVDAPLSESASGGLSSVVAVAQLPVSDDPLSNVDRVLATLGGVRSGRRLVVFPECFLTGYMTQSLAETRERGLRADDTVFARLENACAMANAHIVVGYLESDGEGLYNSVALIGPCGAIGRYRKQHLLMLGADRFVMPGGPSPRVFDTPLGRIGLMTCYDLRFPESARVLALAGADIIAMPTNWPVSATVLADHVTRVRALENRVFLAVADRPDVEAGAPFLGRSQIIDPDGRILVDGGDRVGVFEAEVDVTIARRKRIVVTAGSYELDPIADRRPELYSALTDGGKHV